METTRQQKIAKQIQKDVAEIFQKEGAPIVRGSLVTVTAVRISPDFSYAKIYVSIFPFEQSGEVMKRLTSMGSELGFEVRTKMGMYPKVMWRFAFADGVPGKIKLEINTFERSPMMELTTRCHAVENPFFSGAADIPTFQPEELVATKLRALYQRKKGRDLYDLWLALTVLELDPEKIVAAYPAYRPEGVSGEDLAENLCLKLVDPEFRTDVLAMIRADAPAYDPDVAGELVESELLSRI